MKNLIYTTLLLFGTSTLYAQANFGTLKGKIVENETNDPIPGAMVSLDVQGNIVKTITNYDGRFTIKPLNSGTYNMMIVSGIDTLKQNGILINADKITFVNDLVMTKGLLKTFEIHTWKSLNTFRSKFFDSI